MLIPLIYYALILPFLFQAIPGHADGHLAAVNGPLNGKPRPYGAESSVYQASWNGIPVASAEVRSAPLSVDGKEFYRVQVQAKTWRYLDLIWKMRDSMDSTFEAGTLRPHRFVLQRRENRKKIDVASRFDPSAKRWTVHLEQGGKVKDYEFASADTFDPLSAFYVVRTLDLKVGGSWRLEVFSGRSRYLMSLSVVARERIALRGEGFDAYKLIVRVTRLGSSRPKVKTREATAWISADERRIPLRMASRVFIGSVYIEIVQ